MRKQARRAIVLAITFLAGAITTLTIVAATNANATTVGGVLNIIGRSISPSSAKGAIHSLDGASATKNDPDKNWNGIVQESSTNVSFVRGTFNVPTIAPTHGLQQSDWVGIGGYDQNQLLQAGVTVQQSGKQEEVTPWYVRTADAKFASKNYLSLAIADLTIRPRDRLTVTIRRTSGDNYTIALADDTTGKSKSITTTWGARAYTAEWITEDPFGKKTGLPFARPTSTIRWTNCRYFGDPAVTINAQLGDGLTTTWPVRGTFSEVRSGGKV